MATTDSNTDMDATNRAISDFETPDRAADAASRPLEDTLREFTVDPANGLPRDSVRKRRKEYGPNTLHASKRRSVWRILVDQFKSVVLLVLIAAAILAFSIGDIPEGIALAVLVLVNGLIGFYTEWRAVRSMESLKTMGRPQARVRREGRQREVPVAQLVPGDIVLLEGGDIVPADLRLIEANNMQVDESALTGESIPVSKTTDPTEPDTPLAERHDMLFRGTTLTKGSGEGVVVAIGMQTQLGRIAEMAEEAEQETTPLQKRLNALGSRLAWVVLAIAAVVAGAGLIAGRSTMLMIETAIALGVAAVPEGLPIVATIALARGMWLMARRHALINRLTAVETLGATRVIFTDKTGTLTENRMTLRRVVTPEDDRDLEEDATRPQGDDASARLLLRAVEIGVLCSNAAVAGPDKDTDSDEQQGDPTEIAILRGGLAWDLRRDELIERKPELREVAFDPEVMMMATFHESEDGIEVAVKGAPQAVLDKCVRSAASLEQSKDLTDEALHAWIDRAEKLAREGLRVLAVADKHVDDENEEPYQSLRFVGLLGLYDPPAANVKDSIAACRRAGIRVVMVTGDQPATAEAIGRQVELTEGNISCLHGSDFADPDRMSDEERHRVMDASILARVNPKQKLDLIRIYQDKGEIVAMTGDGINDAPALKKADIGVAMGRRGTDAAREAADMVLKDDAFGSIVAAIEQGRVIFANIRKSVMFMLCTNVAEILLVAVAAVTGLPLPLKPLQILFLNAITDVFPALALGFGEGSPQMMRRPPRDPREAILTRRHWAAIGGWSVLVSTCVLIALSTAAYGFDMDTTTAVTISFMTLGLSKLWFVLNLRDSESRIWNNDVVRNPSVWGAIALCIVCLLAAVYLPGLSTVLKTRALGLTGWSLVIGMSLVPVIVGQIILAVVGSKQKSTRGDGE